MHKYNHFKWLSMFYQKKVGNNRPIQLLYIRTSVGILGEFSFHLKNSDRISKPIYFILYGKVHKWCPILGGHFFKNSVGFSSKMQLTSAIFLCSAVSVSLYQGHLVTCHMHIFHFFGANQSYISQVL